MKYHESVFAYAHGYSQTQKVVFVPNLKLSFNSNFDVWKTDELDIQVSGMHWDPDYMATHPERQKEFDETKRKQEEEVAAIRSTMKEIIIPEDLAHHLTRLLAVKTEKELLTERLKTDKMFEKLTRSESPEPDIPSQDKSEIFKNPSQFFDK